MSKLLILPLLLAAVVGLTVLLFRHFVTNRVTDRGGMESPERNKDTSVCSDSAEAETVCHRMTGGK